MKIKTSILTIIALTCFNIFSQKKGDYNFISAPFYNLTNQSLNFKIDLNFLIPDNYLIVPDRREISKYYLFHPHDLDSINKNGGDMTSTTLLHSHYWLSASTRFYFENGKFSIEKRPGNLLLTRIDNNGYPILKVEGRFEDGNLFNLILIHPHYDTWVVEMWHFPSEKNSILNWKLLSEGLSGKNKNFENKSLETQDFNPIFPDTNEFSHDIYYNEKASTLVYPIKFPNKKQTSELELYDLYNSNFIRRRFTLRTPIDGNIGTEKFKYDTYIEYNMIGDIIEKKESNYHSRVTNSRYSYIVFLLKGIVINYIFIQEVRDKNDNFVLGPQNISKDDFSKENFSNLRLSYLKQRSSLFRRIVANEWFYQDYLNLPPKSKDQIIRLNLENLEEFPDLLYEFKNLKELNISKSAIKTINCNSLKDLKFLESLSLYETLISEIPACINNLPKLKKLMLDQNKIKSIDKAIVQNATISELSLNGNDLRIENKLNPNLKNLTHIYLSRNYIEEIPESWKSLSKLNYIEINSNKINKVPKNLDVLISLEYIYLEKNNIDSFPESLLKNNNLSRLDLSDNNIKYLPEVLCKEISYKNGNPIIYLANNPLNEENLRKIHACNKSYSIFPKPTN